MNITQRDKNLLMILAAAIIIYLLYRFFISPFLEVGAVLSQEKQSVEADLYRIDVLMEQYPSLKGEERTEKAKLSEKYSMFFYDLNQERILNKLDTLLVNSGLNISTYTPTGTAAVPITVSEPVYVPLDYPLLEVASKINSSLSETVEGEATDAAEASAGDDEALIGDIPTTDITLSFDNSSYESVMTFLKAVESMEKSLIVKNISMAKAEAGTGGQIILSLYALPKPDDSDRDLLKFTPVIPKGKTNPFN